ncbi:GNAT family N-acetyltransferase [Aspergillus karnatakaensis]|uniref:GNAT family N-acetyltransferase n=1 Tax=Aspergillus karnatakaensis TaxID=1810916 RepID=UPI003CCD6FAC
MTAQTSLPNYTLRPGLPTDMPTIVRRHATIYSADYNFNESLAALEAQKVVTEYIKTQDPTCERSWIAEVNNHFAGCVILVKDKDEKNFQCAKLRLLLVEPSARGLGLGRELIHQCTVFAREKGYERIRLWTNSGLVTARKLYAREGYELVKSEEDSTFGIPLMAEFWELVL